MKKMKTFVLQIIAYFLIFSILIGCKENTSNENQNSDTIAKDLNVKEFEELIVKKQDLQLVDVRTIEEFTESHLVKATNMDFNKENFRDMLSTLDKSKPIAVYCRVGGRSGKAKKILVELGFKEIYNMDGGILAWQNQGLPTEK
jgi:rhodanese-related sulfurtransferase